MSDIESFQIVMARKPLQGTVADNVTTWGVGGINVDGCRVGTEVMKKTTSNGVVVSQNNSMSGPNYQRIENGTASGRWPANVILDSIAGAALDEQSGVSVSKRSQRGQVEIFKKENSWIGESTERGHSDSGGASRFFYNSDTVDPIIERTNMDFQLLHGDNREQLKHLADNSIDSIVCDPPYELGFMGKRWDSTGIAYDLTVWAECLRVLKPGGHLIAFGGTRTYHRMTVAIEDAGFEIRDCIMWLYGSGFPKSLDISKALDKQAGAEREVITEKRSDMFGEYEVDVSYSGASNIGKDSTNSYITEVRGTSTTVQITAPTTDLAKQWHGWGTALKPAVEPAVLARKPLIGTVADNVTTWGVGGINVDGCRVEAQSDYHDALGNDTPKRSGQVYGFSQYDELHTRAHPNPSGRWPANVILDENAGEELDAQSGVSASVTRNPTGKYILNPDTGWNNNSMTDTTTRGYSDSGGASRFFYTAKASRAEREAGLEGMEVKLKLTQMRSANGTGEKNFEGGFNDTIRANHHPTIKPIALMRYLVRLVTPKGGTVLDPFMGSGSTGCASMCEEMDFIGIELNEEYVEIAKRRIEHWLKQSSNNTMQQLFDL